MARPTKYSPEIETRIVEALRDGCSRRDAYEYGGIDAHTFTSWLKRFSHFSQQVRDAEAAAARIHTANITSAANNGDWRASLEWLKRRRRAEWGDSLDADITSGGGPIAIREIIIERPSKASEEPGD